NNLENGNTCGFSAAGDIRNADPKLGPLADNSGPTHTHALLAGSPAIDAGSSSGFAATDQRGVARPQGGRADIGAYEGTITGSAAVSSHSPSPFAFSPNGDGIKDTTTVSFTLSQTDQIVLEILDPNADVVKTL